MAIPASSSGVAEQSGMTLIIASASVAGGATSIEPAIRLSGKLRRRRQLAGCRLDGCDDGRCPHHLVEGDGHALPTAQHRLDGTAGQGCERAAEPLFQSAHELLVGCHPLSPTLFDATELKGKPRRQVSRTAQRMT